MYKNIFYISNFNDIGGVETFIYELARKYENNDIVVVYKTGADAQIERLRKFIRVIKFKGQTFKCKKAFFNYEFDIIDNIEADEYIRIIHASFKSQGIHPYIHPKITKHLSVSKAAGKEWEELTGIKTTVCRNPLSLTDDEKKPALCLVSATRLTKEKGKERMKRLGELLNDAGAKYIWYVFTNDRDEIKNPNIIFMPPRLDIRPIILSVKGKGYGVQLSDTEGDCYFTRECEALGVPVLATPIPSLKEQGLVDGKNCYFLPFDMQGINISKIVNKIPEYEGYIGEDTWGTMLAKGESTYKKDLKTTVTVRPTIQYYDLVLDRLVNTGETFKVNKIRAEYLQDKDLVVIDSGTS